MKKIRLTSYGAAAALILLAACDEGMDFGNGTGTISPAVSYDPTVVTSRSAGSRGVEFSDLTVDDLTITLTAADGSFSQEFSYADFPVNQGFNVGKYTMTATYGDAEAEGFEQPAVYGAAELTVSEGKTSQVSITAKPSKAMLGLTFDESLTGYMKSVSASITTAAGNVIAYPTAENRYAYLCEGNVTVNVTFEKPNGKGATVQVADFHAKAQHRYSLALSLGGDGVGEVSSLTVKFDESLEQEDVTIDISDEVLSVPAPELTLSGVSDGEVLSVVEGSSLATAPQFKVNARGGIKSAVLTTTGVALLEQGWPAEIDLASLSDSDAALLAGLGLKKMETFRNGSKMAWVDFADVAAHIPATVENASPVMFALTVVDQNGKTSGELPLGFGIKVDKLNLALHVAADYVYTGESTVELLVDYNGTEPLQNVLKVEYLNAKGTFSTGSVASVEVKSRASQTYAVTVNVPADCPLLTFRVKVGSIVSDEVTFTQAPVLAINSNDVFARQLWASLSHPTTDCSKSEIEIYVSTDGANFLKATGTQSGADYHVTGGLNPATTYQVRAKVGNVYSNTVTVTTEAAAQIPGSNLDDWTDHEITASYVFGKWRWTNNIPTSPWSTLNELTMSKPSGASTRSARVSTVYTTDTRSGSGKAAVVRTVGWACTAAGQDPKQLTAGELYLSSVPAGTNYNASFTPNYGYSFSSRPSALKFWYKYTQQNDGDAGLAVIEVLDAAGKVIASATKNVTATGSYQQATLPLTYNRNAAKASQIKVRFRSLTSENLSKSDVTYGKETSQNDTDFIGARFYIDDIELVY